MRGRPDLAFRRGTKPDRSGICAYADTTPSKAHGHPCQTPAYPVCTGPAYTASMSPSTAPWQIHTLPWINRYAQLGGSFHTELPPQGLPQPHWVAHSPDCAALLGWPALWWSEAPEALAVFSGLALWPGMQPLATVYSGHQFGQWAGQLGDGRALLLGEVNSPGGPLEIQLKGAGRTPYSRMGDGRAVLRSSIREFLASEAMHHLGVPSSRALCLTGSSLPVQRERVETAAVVTRVAPSFIRFGHFEHFCHHGQHRQLRELLDFVIHHHLPDCAQAEVPALALLREVCARTASLLAQWQALGFCHGVMNTDNMSILGLTLDYGPFGFLDAFDPSHICNHSDTQGRYAFARQPQVAWWNLHALAQALVPLVGEEGVPALRQTLEHYREQFAQQMGQRMRAKLGLTQVQADDIALIDDWLRLLATDRVDHTIAMRRLCDFVSTPGADNAWVRELFLHRDDFAAWATRYAQRLRDEASDDAQRAEQMRRCNPKYVLRNHLAEQAIQQAEAGDFSEVHRLHTLLSRPYDEQAGQERYADFPPDWAAQLSISCSS